MMRRCTFLMVAVGLCLLTSCERAQQYRAVAKKVETKEEVKSEDSARFLQELSWMPPREVPDLPIVFVTQSSEEWSTLSSDWNHFPMPAIYVGLLGTPLPVAASLAFLEHSRVIKIKVPRGLPDPMLYIQAANPPTYGKWRLGKALFFTPIVTVDSKKFSCATCHDPRNGFAEDPNNPARAKYNAPSLVNVVYNRQQFWDGRVRTLEETLFHGPDDEKKTTPEKRLERGREHHNWGGFVRELVEQKNPELRRQFEAVFGIIQPTQDAVAQSLATYLRTLLSGDSLFDRANNVRRLQGAKSMTAAHFAVVLENEIMAASLRGSLHADRPKLAELPAILAEGYELFRGRARCSQCHSGALFADDDFHNVGLDTKENWPVDGKETGRAIVTPIGLKEKRLIGAFRTPSLRNLVHTYPYFHSGSRRTLDDVIDFYDRGIMRGFRDTDFLAEPLRDGDKAQTLKLTASERHALVIFLRSLEGRPVSANVTAP